MIKKTQPILKCEQTMFYKTYFVVPPKGKFQLELDDPPWLHQNESSLNQTIYISQYISEWRFYGIIIFSPSHSSKGMIAYKRQDHVDFYTESESISGSIQKH